MNLILTRPLAGSEAFWHALPLKVREVLIPIFSPLIEIEPINCSPEIDGSVIFTSVNGVENSQEGNGRIAYCVGAMTTNAAIAAGWDARQEGETAIQLVASLSLMPAKTAFFHLAGTHTRGDIAKLLITVGHDAHRVAVYNQAKRKFTQAANEAIASNFPLLIPLFSPRTAAVFAGQDCGRAPLHIVALSNEVAEPLWHLKWQTLTVCESPTRARMIDEVQKVVGRMTLG